VLEFSSDIMILGELLQNDFDIYTFNIVNGRVLEKLSNSYKWSMPEAIYQMIPSRILYLQVSGIN
jgi:hypothetical protein